MTILFRNLILVFLLLSMAGCGALRGRPYVVHPGAVNELDSRSYDALLFVKGMLTEADRKPPTQPLLVSMVAVLRKAHAAADADWKLYREAVKAGRPAGQLEAAMKASVAAMNAASSPPELAPFRP